MYFANVDLDSADLLALDMVPLQIRRFQLTHASRADVDWLQQTLDRESRRFGAGVRLTSGGRLAASWGNVKFGDAC